MIDLEALNKPKPEKFNLEKAVACLVLLAGYVIAHLFVPINIWGVGINISFLPVALCAMLFGPLPGALIAAFGDILGQLFSPEAYFAGYTFSAFVSGLIYGFFLYRNKLSIVNTMLACATAVIVTKVFLSTLWLSMIQSELVRNIFAADFKTWAVLFVINTLAVFLCQTFVFYFYRSLRHFYKKRENES